MGKLSVKKWNFKKIKWNTRNLLILATCIFLCCVLILTVAAVGLKESGVKPKEDAVSATLVLTGPYSFGGEFINKFNINVDTKKGLEDMRDLESCVKNCTLKEYTDMGVWKAEFSYVKEDGSREERTYRKTGVSKDVDRFLNKYYKA